MPSKKAKPAAATPAALPAGRSGRAFSKMLDAKSAQSLLSQLEQAKKEKQKKKKWYERKIAPEDRVDFSSPLCRCKDDPGVCCIGTWCACIVIPQLYEREIGPPGSCKKWFFRLGVLCSINVVVVMIRTVLVSATFSWHNCPACTWENYSIVPDATVGLVALCLFITGTCMLVKLLSAVRAKIREQDGITVGRFGERYGERADDVCMTCCCICCSVCQIMRHLGMSWGPMCWGVTDESKRGRRYVLASTTGDAGGRVQDGPEDEKEEPREEPQGGSAC